MYVCLWAHSTNPDSVLGILFQEHFSLQVFQHPSPLFLTIAVAQSPVLSLEEGTTSRLDLERLLHLMTWQSTFSILCASL